MIVRIRGKRIDPLAPDFYRLSFASFNAFAS